MKKNSQSSSFEMPPFANTNHSPLLSSYQQLLQNGLLPDRFTFPPLLKSMADSRSIAAGRAIHAHAIKLGLDSDPFVANNLIRLYATCGEIGHARNLFDRIPQRDLVSYTTLVQGYTKLGFADEAVGVFFEMLDVGSVKPDAVAFAVALSACAELGDLKLGKDLHRYINSYDIALDVHAANALIDMYSKCGDVSSAYKLFAEMLVRNVVTWNTMISGFASNGEFRAALSLFRRMQRAHLSSPDGVTLVAVLNSCAHLGALEVGEWAHAYIRHLGMRADGFIGNALVDMYAKCGCMEDARRVFEAMKRRDVYTYTSMIAGFAMNGQAKQALRLFGEMKAVGIRPNDVTFVGVLTACAHAGLVIQGLRHLQSMVKVYKLIPQVQHYGCVVDMLGRAGLLSEAHKLAHCLPMEPDAFVWNALLGACKMHENAEVGEVALEKLISLEADDDGSYVLMSNIYAAADRRRDASRMRKAMEKLAVKKRPGCSLIQVDGRVHEFRVGGRSHPRNDEIYCMLSSISEQITSHYAPHLEEQELYCLLNLI